MTLAASGDGPRRSCGSRRLVALRVNSRPSTPKLHGPATAKASRKTFQRVASWEDLSNSIRTQCAELCSTARGRAVTRGSRLSPARGHLHHRRRPRERVQRRSDAVRCRVRTLHRDRHRRVSAEFQGVAARGRLRTGADVEPRIALRLTRDEGPRWRHIIVGRSRTRPGQPAR